MQTLEELKAKQAAEFAKLERETALALLCPVPPARVMDTSTKSLGEAWITYKVSSLWEALDVMRQFQPVPFYEFKKTFTRYVPAALNVGRDAGDEKSGPYVAKIDTSQGEGYGPTVEMCFFALVGDAICKIRCDQVSKWGAASWHSYGARFQTHSGGRSRQLDGNRYIHGDFRPNAKLSGMMDKVTQWGAGCDKSASFTYAISADDEAGAWLDAGLRLENIAEAMHGPRPLYRFDFDSQGGTGIITRLADNTTSPRFSGDEAWKLYNVDRYGRRDEIEAAAADCEFR